jgi:hypothetical protein
MPSKFMERGWPTVRLEKSEKQAGNKRWLHGDYKDAPYNLVWKLYDMFVKIDTGHSKGNK